MCLIVLNFNVKIEISPSIQARPWLEQIYMKGGQDILEVYLEWGRTLAKILAKAFPQTMLSIHTTN